MKMKLAEVPNPPFVGAERLGGDPPDAQEIELHKKGDDLFLNGRRITLALYEGQIPSCTGWKVKNCLSAKHVSSRVLDCLAENPCMWPESWKGEEGRTLYVFFWDDVYKNPEDGRHYVRYGCWNNGKVVRHYRWLDHPWAGDCPAATV